MTARSLRRSWVIVGFLLAAALPAIGILRPTESPSDSTDAVREPLRRSSVVGGEAHQAAEGAGDVSDPPAELAPDVDPSAPAAEVSGTALASLARPPKPEASRIASNPAPPPRSGDRANDVLQTMSDATLAAVTSPSDAGIRVLTRESARGDSRPQLPARTVLSETHAQRPRRQIAAP